MTPLYMHKKHSGMTLLECLFVITLGAIFLILISKIYIGSKELYKKQADISELQENIHLAASILTHNIRTAGFIGCPNLSTLKLEKHYIEHEQLPEYFSFENAIYGFDSKDAPDYLKNKIARGTCGIIVRKVEQNTALLSENIVEPTSKINIISNPSFEKDDVIVVSDCDNIDVFKANGASDTSVSLAGSFKIRNNYNKKDSQIGKFTETAYFISKSSRKNSNENPIYGLYTVKNRESKEELLSNITNMQIKYGLDENKKKEKTKYYFANEITKNNLWGSVRSVIIAITLSSHNNKTKEINFYITLRE